MSEVVCVKCKRCDRLHEKSSDGYVTIEGNVYVGDGGGIIGGQPGEDGSLPVNHFCFPCLVGVIQESHKIPPFPHHPMAFYRSQKNPE